MSRTNPKVDAFIGREARWRTAFERLRAIVLACGLDEELKWGKPCYAVDGRNVCIIHGFKDYCALLFVKGALLADPAGVLIQQTPDVQSARQIRFTSADEVAQQANVVTDYVQRAIEVEKAGLKIRKKTTEDFAVADEFKRRLDADAGLKAAFQALTPGRQRGWLLYFSSAKQAGTREARVGAAIPRILAGQGRDD
jgi:uncharacterized protein YdeI (YjbR/CyaY-like superfamily)